MGLFDTLRVPCPMCGEIDHMQVKPVDVSGDMTGFDLVTAPNQVLERVLYTPEECSCGCVYCIVPAVNNTYALRAGRDIPLNKLPLRVMWTEHKPESTKTRGEVVRKRFTMTKEQQDKLLDACKPVPYMVMGGSAPRSPRENANAAWCALGREMGFDGMTVQPDGSSQLNFTAEVVEQPVPTQQMVTPEFDMTTGQELPDHPADCLFCSGRGFYTVGGGRMKLICNSYLPSG